MYMYMNPQNFSSNEFIYELMCGKHQYYQSQSPILSEQAVLITLPTRNTKMYVVPETQNNNILYRSRVVPYTV